MEGSAIAPPKTVVRQGYLIVTVLLGIAGSLVALTGFGHGTYRVGALLVEMKVKPSTEGTTQLAVEFAQYGLTAGTVKEKTHSGFLALEGNVVGTIGTGPQPDALAGTVDPATFAKKIRDDGKEAIRKFGIRLALVVLAGGASGGFVIALVGLKARRIFQGALAGVLVVGLLGLLAWQTYDIKNFDTAKFRPITLTRSNR